MSNRPGFNRRGGRGGNRPNGNRATMNEVFSNLQGGPAVQGRETRRAMSFSASSTRRKNQFMEKRTGRVSNFSSNGGGKTRGNRQGNRRGGRNGMRRGSRRRGGFNKKLTPEDLDREMDEYMGRNEKVMKERLDEELDTYMQDREQTNDMQQ